MPEWMDRFRVSDNLFTNAYEQCPPKCRTALKTGLAITACHFNNYGMEIRHEIKNKEIGFNSFFCQKPLDWAIFFIDASFSASARLEAALALPALANVSDINLVAIGEELALPCLMACELCGVNDVFQIKENMVNDLIKSLNLSSIQSGNGKICLIHSEGSLLRKLFNEAYIPYCELNGNANIKVLEELAFDLDILAYTQNYYPEKYNPQVPADCIYTLDNYKNKDAPLVLGLGCEGFWLYPNLSPACFTMMRQAFFQIEN